MDIRSISLDPEHVAAYEKLKAAGKYKNLSQFVRKCINEHFESEFPDLEGEAALKRAEELEFAAKNYRAMAEKPKPISDMVVVEPAALTAQEEEIFKATAAGAANE